MKTILLFLLAVIACTAQIPNVPNVDWAGCGPSYNGHNFGVSCAMGIPISSSQGLDNYTVVDLTFYRGKALQRISDGVQFKARQYSFGKLSVRVDLLAAPGVATAQATTFSLTGGLHLGATYGEHWTFGAGYRGLTGSTGGKIYDMAIVYSFRK